MEKLINLINEYEQLNMCRKFDSFEMHAFEDSNGVDRLLEDTVISCRYGFIKRLVKNDKIDLSNEEYFYQDTIYELEQAQLIKDLSDYLIMKLSISDNPIEDLISYLK